MTKKRNKSEFEYYLDYIIKKYNINSTTQELFKIWLKSEYLIRNQKLRKEL